ncbi:MAG: type IV secretion system DNA-binding domain-containing protein [Steroidobacteraceae bacterium]
MDLQQLFYEYTHGWHGLVVAYALVGVFVLAGLIRSRASVGHYIAWPLLAVPTFAIAAVVLVAVQWVLASLLHLALGDIAQSGVAAVVLMAVGFLGGRYWATRSTPMAALIGRGAVVHEAGAHPLAASQRKARLGAGTLALAGVAVPPEDETKHFKLMGTTGTGKSTAMRELLYGALTRGDRAVIADPDGGYLSRFYNPSRGDVILNPFDKRSLRWDLFAELKSPYDVEQLARALIPERGGDPQWPGFARTYFECVTRQAQAAGVADIGELYRLITSAPQEEIRALVTGTPAAPFAEEGNLKMFLGMRSTASEHIKSFDYIRKHPGRAVSVKEWVKRGHGVLFLPYQAEQIAAVRSVISTWMRLAIFQTMGLGEGDHRLWFAVDELDALGAIDGLPDALARLRKFGGRCVLGFQSIAQVSTTYGMGPAQAMVENCGNTLILRCSASERGGTARFASQLIGERDVVRVTTSRSRSDVGFFGGARHETLSESQHHATESAVLPSEIEQLPDRAGFLKLASHPAWMRVSFPVYELPQVAEPFVPIA